MKKKVFVVECWNKTIKQKLWKMFSRKNNTVYYDKLNKLVDDYNNTRHSGIKMTPAEASLNKNERKVFLLSIW